MTSENKNSREPKGYFHLVGLGEPFRLLFPLGAIIGILGVLMWPLFVWHITKTYPGMAHPRVMIEGFATCFVIGFLGTALPRLLDVPRITLAETVSFAAALIAIAACHCEGQMLWGDGLFFCTLAAFVLLLLRRASLRKDTPPPAFVLVGMGLLSGLAGSAIQALAQMAPLALGDAMIHTGRLLLNQGYLLLPIMGIGAFLLPRFFGLPNRQSFPESHTLPPGWKGRALFALACGVAVIASFIIEAAGQTRWGCGLRAVAVIIYILREVPIHEAGFNGGTLAFGLRVALFAIPFGFTLMAIWPERIFSFFHVVFITGFSLLIFIVGTRVVLGHSGQSAKFRAPPRPVLIMALLLILAMLTRVTADWMPALCLKHYGYAASVWIAAVIIWAVSILPGVRRADAGLDELAEPPAGEKIAKNQPDSP